MARIASKLALPRAPYQAREQSVGIVEFAARRSFRGRQPACCRPGRDTTMKNYLLSVCYPAENSQPSPDVLNRIMSDVAAVRKEMQAAGVWLISGGLYPTSSATVLRHQDGEIVITDGPFIESKEQ